MMQSWINRFIPIETMAPSQFVNSPIATLVQRLNSLLMGTNQPPQGIFTDSNAMAQAIKIVNSRADQELSYVILESDLG